MKVASEQTNSRVSVYSCSEYVQSEVLETLRLALQPLGGIGKFVKSGSTVLLNPNLLSPCSPEQAVTTHPMVVKAMVEPEENGVCSDYPLAASGFAPACLNARNFAE